jgi:outer membrane lipoprotein-sorting protein
MRNKLKITAIMLVMVLIMFSFAACGGSSSGNLADNVNQILKSGTYQMTFSMETTYQGTSENMEMTIAVKDKNMAGKMTSNGVNIRFILKDNKYYIINDDQKIVMCMDVEEGDVQVPDFSDIFSENLTLSNKSNVTVNGKSLLCEEYKIADGSVKYYFSGKTLVRMETTYGSSTQTMEIKEIKATIDDSLFDIPSGYQQISM